MDQYDYIRTAHRVYGKKIKQIARETGHSKNTVKRVLRGEYTGYKARSQQPYPVLGPYLKTIDQWLEDDILLMLGNLDQVIPLQLAALDAI